MAGSQSTQFVRPLQALIGHKFGSWTVLAIAPKKGRNRYFTCRCECGTEKDVAVHALKAGKSKSCLPCYTHAKGSLQTGDRHGSWTVLRKDLIDSRAKYWCRCDCGHEKYVNPSSMLRGSSKGCRNCSDYRQRNGARKTIWNNVIRGARQRGLEVKVAPQAAWELLEKQGFRCALTNLPIRLAGTWKEHRRGGTTASLDRIDSAKGYVEGNVQWLHRDVNQMKWDLAQERFLELCGLVVKKHGAN